MNYGIYAYQLRLNISKAKWDGWKNCKSLVFIISRVLFGMIHAFCLKDYFLFHGEIILNQPK